MSKSKQIHKEPTRDNAYESLLNRKPWLEIELDWMVFYYYHGDRDEQSFMKELYYDEETRKQFAEEINEFNKKFERDNSR